MSGIQSRPRPQAFSGPASLSPSEIELTQKIGEGCFGTVYKGKCRTVPVAVKVPRRQKLSRRGLEAFRKEVLTMSKIYHPNVCLFMGACTIPGSIMIVTELMSTDVEQMLKQGIEKNSLSTRMRWAKDAAQGVCWLHGNNPPIIHRDLKTQNFLVDENGKIKVCDFGLSDFLEGEAITNEAQPKGTPLYMAPEVMMGQEITEKVDVYSFGIILWEMLSCKEAFGSHTSYDTFYKAVCLEHERPVIPDNCPPLLVDLMKQCWQHDPYDRPTFPTIVDLLDGVITECESFERKEAVKKAISDPVGQQFWIDHFLTKDEIPWPEFARHFYEKALKMTCPVDPSESTLPDDATEEMIRMASRLQLENYATKGSSCSQQVSAELKRRTSEQAAGYQPSQYVAQNLQSSMSDDSRGLLCLKVLIAPDEVVTLEEFGKLVGWFGTPEPVSEDDLSFVDRIVDLLRQPWFHGSTGTRDAENTLKIFPRGTFLIRFSNSHKNSFVISKVSAQRIIKHVVVPYVHKKGFKLDGHYFSSLQELIPRSSAKYFLKSPCPGSKYAWLFEEDVANVGGYGE